MTTTSDVTIDQKTFEEYKDIMGDKFELGLKVYLEDARSAVVEILNALEIRDRDTIVLYAHKLKSPSRMIGAYALADHCENIEGIARKGTDISNEDIDRLKRCFTDTAKALNG